MINKDNKIKELFDYSDSLVLKKTINVLRKLEQDKEKIIDVIDRNGMLKSGLLFKELIDRDLEAIEEIVNYQVDCDLNEISLPLTKHITDKIYLRAKTNTENRLNILNGTLKNYGRLWNKNENLIISMKSQYNNKIAHILDNARLEIKSHQKKYEIEISMAKKRKISVSIKFLIYFLALLILSYIYWKYFSNIFIENPPFNIPLEYKFRLNILFQLVIIISLLIPFIKKYWYIFVASDITIILVILGLFR